MRYALVLAVLAPMLALVGCPGDPAADPIVCLEAGSLPACTPTYDPTYDNVYAKVFQPTCAKSGFSCHSPEGHQGNLNFFDKEMVLASMKSHSVKAGSPECSLLVQRMVSLDGFFRMPPGRSLPAASQCAVIQWVANGANR